MSNNDIQKLAANPAAPSRASRALRITSVEQFAFFTADGVQLRLLRTRGGDKGPVVLSHCIGVSSLMYAIDTVETNLVEYLAAHEFDVWLLDHRLSIALPVSRQPGTLDDVAMLDYPAAIAAVRRESGAESVAVVAHGVGSSTLTMALLAGLTGVSSAVCSQVSTHLSMRFLNDLKARLRFASLLSAVGIRSLSADGANSPLTGRLFDHLLALYPFDREERCESKVCHRITAMYGSLYEHDQLDAETHENLHEVFGVVNIAAFRQLEAMTRQGWLCDADGHNSYIPHLERLAIPMTLIHGGENDCVLPGSTAQTLELLRKRNGGLYKRHVVPDYGHVDCIIGRTADQDVFPLILDHLETTSK